MVCKKVPQRCGLRLQVPMWVLVSRRFCRQLVLGDAVELIFLVLGVRRRPLALRSRPYVTVVRFGRRFLAWPRRRPRLGRLWGQAIPLSRKPTQPVLPLAMRGCMRTLPLMTSTKSCPRIVQVRAVVLHPEIDVLTLSGYEIWP